MMNEINEQRQRRWYLIASISLIALVLFMTAREAFIAPLHPGGSWLVLKALPIAIAVFGVLKRRLYTFQWAALLVWLYIAFSLVGAVTDATQTAREASAIETVLGLLFFVAAAMYVHPYKRLARVQRRRS